MDQSSQRHRLAIQSNALRGRPKPSVMFDNCSHSTEVDWIKRNIMHTYTSGLHSRYSNNHAPEKRLHNCFFNSSSMYRICRSV